MSLSIYSSLTYSPTWYTTNALDTLEWNHDDKSGIFYYGARNAIYFIKVQEIADNTKLITDETNRNVYFDAKLCYYMQAHHEYIIGVCTLPNEVSMLFKNEQKIAKLISCGKDKRIRVWSFDELNGCCCLKEFNIANTKLFTNVTCISVSARNTVVCGFEKGFLLAWNYTTDNEWKTFTTESEDIVHIEWHGDKLAVGHKRGFVSVYSMNRYDSLVKITRFRGQHSDTCNISWNPFPDTAEVWGDLATSGKDNKVNLWRIDTNVNLKSLKLPSMARKCVSDVDSSGGGSSTWSSLCWSLIDHGTLLISTGFGNIGVWKNPSVTDLKCFPPNQQHKSHTKTVFGIKEWRNYRGLIVSHSLDRTININRITDSGVMDGCVYSLTGLGGSVMSLAGVGHTNMLAVGCADKCIRLWRLDAVERSVTVDRSVNLEESVTLDRSVTVTDARPDTVHRRRPYDVTSIWNGVNERVMSLCWHPSRDGLLAFATEDGQVGIINVSRADKKEATNSLLQHRSKVFVVTWGRDIRARDSLHNETATTAGHNSLIVYSVGNYALYGHDFRTNDYFDASAIVSDNNNSGISDFCVHGSLDYFAVGYGNGSVNIFAMVDLTRLCTITTHTKGINCMAFSPHSNQLAIGSNERFLSITDLRRVFDEFTHCRAIGHAWLPLDISETVALLKGHGDRITCVSWSPFDEDAIVSGSYDWTVFVWSVRHNAAVASFNGHHGKVLCCHWSERDADLIYSGAEDCNLFGWRLSQQSLRAKYNKRRPQRMVDEQTITVTKEDNGDKTVSKEDKTVSKDEQHKDSDEQIVHTTKKAFVKKRPSLFPTTLFCVHHSVTEYQSAMINFVADNGSAYLPCLAVFGSRATILAHIEAELVHLSTEGGGNLDNYFMVLIWCGKIGRVVRECVTMNYTPDWLMTVVFGLMAKDVSPSVVNTMISNIVTNRKDPLLAATYWLAMNETMKAIELLVNEKYVREALVLAKLRLAPDHPLIRIDLVSQLLEIYVKNGSFELAAMCCLSLANYRRFIDIMNKRNTYLSQWTIIKALIGHRQGELVCHCVGNFVNGLLLDIGDKEKPMIDTDQWTDKLKSELTLAHYLILVDLHRALWIDKKNIGEIVTAMKTDCQKYGRETVLDLRAQISSRLSAKQMNQMESQLRLYITYEVFGMVIDAVYGANEEVVSHDSLKECLSHLKIISPEEFVVARLLDTVDCEDNLANMLRRTLSMLDVEE